MTTLQELLNFGLMDIGSDDSRFAKMEAAGEALVHKLKTEPTLIIPATLISIDSDVGEEEQFFEVVEKLVIEQWKTMRNTHINRPRELLRAITIHALALVAKESPEMSSAIWQTAVSPLNHGQAKFGKEADLVKKLLQDFGEYAEREADARTALAKPITKKQLRKKAKHKGVFKIQPISKLIDSELIMDVVRSAGPQKEDGESLEDPNPHWPNAHQQWSFQFAPRMTTALAKAVNLGMTRMSETLSASMEHFIDAFEKQLTEHLESIETIRSEVLKSQQSIQIRLNVLWWFEAKYSPTLMLGYRELPAANASLAMAYDLTQIVPPLAPASVTYVLGEAVAALFQRDTTPRPQSIQKYLDNLCETGSALRDIVPKVSNNGIRQPLFELTAEATSGIQISSEDVRGRAGIDPTLELTFPEFAMWTFRDLQARRLMEEIK